MSEENLADNLSPLNPSIEDQAPSIIEGLVFSEDSENDGILLNQNVAASSTLDSPSSITSANYVRLLDDLTKTRSLECQHIRRIYQLEKALDQVLIYLEELKVKVRDHEFLQDQLSMTEDFAYVQQHAIAHLKGQLNEQKQILISQNSEAREYDEAVQSVLGETEQLIEDQQLELEHLKTRLAQDFAEESRRHRHLKAKLDLFQSTLTAQQEQMQNTESDALAARTFAASLEIQLTASQQQVKDLSVRLAESQTRFVASQRELQEAKNSALERQELFEALNRSETLALEQTRTIATLKRKLAIAETATSRLDAERDKVLNEQARWQRRCQDLEAECDRHQTVLIDLDQHNTAMQEEIFQQTRQAVEYEAAIQFWKERYLSSQRQLAQLKQLLEREAPHLSEYAAEDLLQAVQLAIHPEHEDSEVLSTFPSPQFNTVDMPEFLIRRYAIRNRPPLNRDFYRLSSSDS